MRLVDERLERNRGSIRRVARHERTFAHAAAYLFGKLLPIGDALRVLRFGRIGEKAAFNEH